MNDLKCKQMNHPVQVLCKGGQTLMEIEIDNSNITNFVIKAKNGDRDAFVTIFQFYKNDLYRIAKTMLNADHDVSDVIQETIFIAYKRLHQLKNNEFFKTWLIRILINECKRVIKSQNKLSLFDLAQAENQVAEVLDSSDLDVVQLVQKLKVKLRDVIVLHYIEELSVDEVAQVLEIPSGTVKSRLSKAREQLKMLMEVERENNG